MFVKCYLTSKRGERRDAVEDSISVDLQSGRFAVSDGVSKSFLPKVWSNILTQAWISVEKVEDFPPNEIYEQFCKERNRIFELLDEDTRMDYDDLERKHQTASATFCGVEIHHGKLKWVIIGDSCLFLLPEGEHPLCISSCPMPTDKEGRISPHFNNTPYQILANGKVYGEWNRGERTFEKGIFLLMSDAMSEWFINAHNNDNKPLEQLLALKDDESFEQWVDEQYNLGLLKSDDESVIIVHFDEVDIEEHIIDIKNSVSIKKDANFMVESFNVSEKIKTLKDDEGGKVIQLDDVNQKEQMVDNKDSISTKKNEHIMVEPSDASKRLIKSREILDEGIVDQPVKKKKISIRKKKMYWFVIAAFLRLIRIKSRKTYIK